MRSPSTPPTLVLSFDVRSVASSTDETLERLVALELRATWALDESAAASLGRHLGAAPGQELAILASPPTDAAYAERRVLHLTTALQLAAMRRHGQAVTSIVGEGWSSSDDLEMLVRQGVTAVRVSMTAPGRKPRMSWRLFGSRRAADASSVRALRWGLRELSPTQSMPQATPRAVRRAMSAAHKSPLVLAIDLSQASPRNVLAVLEQIARLRDGHRLQAMGIADCVAQMDASLQSRPTRSILKASAA